MSTWEWGWGWGWPSYCPWMGPPVCRLPDHDQHLPPSATDRHGVGDNHHGVPAAQCCCQCPHTRLDIRGTWHVCDGRSALIPPTVAMPITIYFSYIPITTSAIINAASTVVITLFICPYKFVCNHFCCDKITQIVFIVQLSNFAQRYFTTREFWGYFILSVCLYANIFGTISI